MIAEFLFFRIVVLFSYESKNTYERTYVCEFPRMLDMFLEKARF